MTLVHVDRVRSSKSAVAGDLQITVHITWYLHIGGNPILIAMGDKTYGILEKNLGHKYTIKKMSHYARAVSKEEYRTELLELIRSLEK